MTVVSIGSAISSAPVTVPAEQTTPVSPGAIGPQGSSGLTGPTPWDLPPVAWQTDVAYSASAPASTVIFNGTFYFCVVTHISGAVFDATKFQTISTNIDGGSF